MIIIAWCSASNLLLPDITCVIVQVKKKILWIKKRRAYTDGIKRKGDKIGMEYEA